MVKGRRNSNQGKKFLTEKNPLLKLINNQNRELICLQTDFFKGNLSLTLLEAKDKSSVMDIWEAVLHCSSNALDCK